MPSARIALAFAATLAVAVSLGGTARGTPYSERPAAIRALYTAGAVVANVLPGASALVAPQCLPGYVLCKAVFAGFSVVAAVEQLVWSGGADRTQTRAILYRGFAGDWYLTGRHVAGDLHAQPWPEPPPAPHEGSTGGFEPPPL